MPCSRKNLDYSSSFVVSRTGAAPNTALRGFFFAREESLSIGIAPPAFEDGGVTVEPNELGAPEKATEVDADREESGITKEAGVDGRSVGIHFVRIERKITRKMKWVKSI